MASDGKRLRFVDGLRGIAAAMVMLYHLVGRTSAAWLTQHGDLGVAIFFVLSGFVITAVLGTRRMNLAFLGRFALRRMIRLDIPYWLNIAVALALGAFAASMGVAKHSVTVGQVAAHLVYLQTLLGYQEISSVYWTLCLEVQFYLTLILLLWGAQRLRLRQSVFIGLFLALLALSLLANMEWIATPAGLMLRYWWGFALGALCYWTLARGLPARWLAIAAAVVLLSSPALHGDWRVLGLVTTALLFLAWRWDRMDRWLADGFWQFLGRISYSLYLFHPLIGWSAQSLALRYMNQWGALAVGLTASIVSAWLAWRFIERPSITLSHRVSLESVAAVRKPLAGAASSRGS